MRLDDLKPFLPVVFNLLVKSERFNNSIMYPFIVMLQIMHPED